MTLYCKIFKMDVMKTFLHEISVASIENNEHPYPKNGILSQCFYVIHPSNSKGNKQVAESLGRNFQLFEID